MSLIKAVRNNDTNKVMQLLATNKMAIYETDSTRWTPLIWASVVGNKEIVGILLNHDNSQKHTNHGSTSGLTALMYASHKGHKEIVEMLLNHDNSPEHINRQDDGGMTALMYASHKGHKEIVEMLLNHDNSPEHINRQDDGGMTALMYASYYNHEKIVEILLEHGASVDILNVYNKSAADLAKTEEIKELLSNWEPKGAIRAKGAQF